MTTDYAPSPEHNCPSCGSPSPERHPAVQLEGEVEICVDNYHLIPTVLNTEKHRASVLAKQEAGK